MSRIGKNPVNIKDITFTQKGQSIKVKGKLVQTHLEAGKAYFFNTGFAHGVFNEGDEPRIAFMFSLDGQDDISNIKL